MQVSPQEYLVTTPMPERIREDLRQRWAELRGGRYQPIIILGPPAEWREIPTITETIARLDRVIANVRRYQ